MAGMIPEEVIDNVRSAVNIVDVVSRYVQLRKAGKNLFGICPFHDEKTPSFSVSEDKQIFHCFSCGRGGNVFKFLMDLEKISFPEAVRRVAEFGNVPLDDKYVKKSPKSAYSAAQSEMIGLYEKAAELYHHVLVNTQLGEKTLAYLKKRGITEADLQDFDLGFAPADQDLLLSFLKEQQIDQKQMQDSGLFIETADGSLKDRFFNRIMFPIKDNNGKIVAFSGRSLVKDDQHPKYLNSPETSIFNKGKVLYNFSQARPEIVQKKTVILYEGFMDVIAAHRAQVANGIATMGTSLTEDHVRALKRVASRVVICFDGDEPGQRAIAKAIALIKQTSDLQISVIFIPDNRDPDEYVRDKGVESFQKLMNQTGESSTAFLLKFDRMGLNLANENDQLEYLKKALRRIGELNDALEQDLYLNQLAEEFSIDKRDLKNQLRESVADRIAHTPRQFDPGPAPAPPPTFENQVEKTENTSKKLSSVDISQYRLLARALNHHDVWLKLQSLPDFYFPNEQLETIYMLAGGYLAKNQEYDAADFMDYLKEPELQSVVANIESINLSPDYTEEEIEDYISLIKDVAPLSEQISKVKSDLNEATRLGNQELQQQLTLKLISLYQKQQKLQN
ncbi:DNA primase [Pediococcus acidilactici]|uniref:DNA primase n=1 Tax=Pediococcus acidilactici TaxID=1254 RepID=UPI00032715B3|nr:DNA primase [Pediococcus acidilactici]EOA09405.1 DNA primase, dnaG [Pediococcus acidilactici D3]MBW4796885.1 DNA primase [Pediococcus acidilactici]MBW9306137.1 DNA primase [Pediococcus acidilactici]MCE5961441.1 DNA primase [Pediococcus acidilactici]MCW8082372.1 DNA primase [Pediococcus acidilactici]